MEEMRPYRYWVPLNVAFVCDRPFNWDCLASTYDAFERRNHHSLAVLTPSAATYSYLSRLGVFAAGVGDPATIHRIVANADVLFTANPKAIQPFLLDQDSCKVVYVPYGMTISGAEYSYKQQHDLWIHNRAWRVIAGSGFHRDLYETHCSSGAAHVAPIGNPKWDLVNSVKSICQPTFVLWNIHYTVSAPLGMKWSTWFEYGGVILEYFKRHPELTLIVRPHPGFLPAVRECGLEEDTLRALRAVPNIILDDSPSPTESIRKCSALLTDGSSMIYDFGVTGKRLLYLRTAESERLHDHAFAFVRTHFEIGDSADKVERFLDGVRNNPAEGWKMRRDNAQAFLNVNPLRSIGELIHDYVTEILSSDSQGSE